MPTGTRKDRLDEDEGGVCLRRDALPCLHAGADVRHRWLAVWPLPHPTLRGLQAPVRPQGTRSWALSQRVPKAQAKA